MSALLLWAGNHLLWCPSQSVRPEAFRIPGSVSQVAAFLDAPSPRDLPPGLRARLSGTGAAGVQTFDSVCEKLLAVGPSIGGRAAIDRVRRGRDQLPADAWNELRSVAIALAERQLAAALSSPTEVLTSLAREEERVERALVRETGAAEQWVSGTASDLAEYKRDWDEERNHLAEYHGRLLRRLEVVARNYAPNLSAVVGPRIAARLIAAGGGIDPLSRMSSGRLQLLGTRRRPGAGRGPRYGIIVRAEGMGSVPPERQGAMARSLASIAVVAARADATTRRDLAEVLQERKARRIHALNRRRRS